MDLGKATVVGAILTAVITGIFLVGNEFVKKGLSARPIEESATPAGAVTCDPVQVDLRPPPNPKTGYLWVPADFKLTAGKLEPVAGHWERRKANGADVWIPGHWDTDTGQCVWVRGEFVVGN